MHAEIIGIEDGLIGVKVIDSRSNRHLIEIDIHDESDDGHYQDAYSQDASERSEDVERIMEQALARGRFEAHVQTEFDIIRPSWGPSQIDRGIQALEQMPRDEFADTYHEYYEALLEPERIKHEYGITEGAVEFPGEPQIALILKGFCIDEANTVVNTVDDLYIYYTNEQTDVTYSEGDFASCDDNTTLFTSMLPPFDESPADFTYPADFRGLLINNLICQARDVYRNMGEEPPEKYDIEGFSKPSGPLTFA